MHTMIQQALAHKPGTGSILQHSLPWFISELQEDFTRFADCGAGVGATAIEYGALLRELLRGDNFSKAKVVCYEPLEENFREMEKCLTGSEYVLRRAAVGEKTATQTLSVGQRMGSNDTAWPIGTAYDGLLGKVPGQEWIDVDVVRLDEDGHGPFDFIKLDLQGGELAALTGAEKIISSAKMVYVEHQLFEPGQSAVGKLEEYGLFPFIDQLQFSFLEGRFEVPLQILADTGISIKRIRLGDGIMPNLMWGEFIKTPPLTRGLTFPEELTAKLRAFGVSYIQTDILAVAPAYLGVLARAVNCATTWGDDHQ